MPDLTNPFQNRNDLKDHFKKDETFALVALKNEVERFRAELDAANARIEGQEIFLAAIRSACDELSKQLAAARETLEIYAAPFGKGAIVPDFYAELDFGDKARNALERKNNE